MKGASKRGRRPWLCRLAPPIRSFRREEWIRDSGLVVHFDAGGAGAVNKVRPVDEREGFVY